MMKSTARFFFLGAFLAALVILPTSVQATLQLTLTVTGNGGPSQTETVPLPTSGSLQFDGFNISGLSAFSTLATDTLSISPFHVTNGGSGGTLKMTLSEDGFTTPGPYGLNLISTASVVSSTGVTTFQSYIGSGLGDESGLSTTLQTFPATIFGTSTVLAYPYHPAGSTFSLTNVSTFALGHNGSVQVFTGDTSISTPEPATLAMALAGLPMVALIGWRRNRSRNRAARLA